MIFIFLTTRKNLLLKTHYTQKMTGKTPHSSAMLVKTETHNKKLFLPKSWQTNKAAFFLDYVYSIYRKWPTTSHSSAILLERDKHD